MASNPRLSLTFTARQLAFGEIVRRIVDGYFEKR